MPIAGIFLTLATTSQCIFPCCPVEGAIWLFFVLQLFLSRWLVGRRFLELLSVTMTAREGVWPCRLARGRAAQNKQNFEKLAWPLLCGIVLLRGHFLTTSQVFVLHHLSQNYYITLVEIKGTN